MGRQEEVKDILEAAHKAGPGSAGRKTLEIHLHINGPLIVGTDVANNLLPAILKATRATKVQGSSDE